MSAVGVDKAVLLGQVLDELEREWATLVSAQRSTSEGVTHEENRAEGDKDMRSTEASYLARGQAQRVAQLSEEIQRLKSLVPRRFGSTEPIAATALVSVEAPSGRLLLFLLPGGAGVRLGGGVRIVTPGSPLGSALLGARSGDVVEVLRGDEPEEYEISGVE